MGEYIIDALNGTFAVNDVEFDFETYLEILEEVCEEDDYRIENMTESQKEYFLDQSWEEMQSFTMVGELWDERDWLLDRMEDLE